MRDIDILVVEGSHDWSALYINGKLERVGDHYLIHDRLMDKLGIAVEQSDAFLIGGDGRENAAQTVDEYRAEVRRRATAAETAEELERRAAEMLAEAAAMRAQS